MTDRKRCTRCGEVKQLDAFAKDKRRPDGRHAQCKACRNAYQAEYRANGGLTKGDYGDRYKGRYKGHYSGFAERLRSWIKKNPGSHTAHKAVARAVKQGKLPRVAEQACAHCGKPAQAYHHAAGYSGENKLRVIALCDKCHRALHAQLRHSKE